MPRRLLGVFMLLLVTVALARAQGDVVLFIVGSDTVYQSTFDARFSRSLEKRPDVFFQTYIRFKQKVQYAKELKLDTLSAYLQQKKYNQEVWEFQRQEDGHKSIGSLSGKEWLKLVHVSYPLNQHGSKAEELKGLLYLDSLYSAWKDGRWNLNQAEKLPWMQPRYLLEEWQVQLRGLSMHELSKPFYSPMGIHIVALEDKVVGRAVEEVSAETQVGFDVEEIEEGLLIAALENYWEENLHCTPQDLETYFRQNRSDYGWGTPHYRGAIIHCQNKKEAKRIQKYLKKYPVDLWLEAWKRMPAEISSNSRLEVGLFAIGTNPYVDKLVFKCGAFEPLAEYPFTTVFGKTLKKGPEHYRDVREKIEKDCLRAKKEAEIVALQLKYKVEINEEVLKTVNHAGNK